MSACGRAHLLEALATGALSPGQAQELRAHLRGCAVCRHELNWLETEQRLFRERAAREEVAELWKGAQRWPIPVRPWRRIVLGLAASVMLVVASGGVKLHTGWRGEASVSDGSPLVSEDNQSRLRTETSAGVCPLGEGRGFHCGPAIPASFLASR